ncbi:Aut related protein [Thermoplasma acidophilum]|uniref:FAD synthase n=1 Tax=Thermoplasma acidophilum (strain ATCC 25905 / DSM 1728 / JCM 9062 / NBRC 15155 / AMRC-C165) TaxID=273075 RepID=RIBL_THEAC|nr:adenylyltransferase/cytidyltransferase family protein [Thermoplasma acidophilum]Q9HJ34.1 RecName: Full=FAD synthase; AltName: Full=FMN adenylyltransferase; AltName: Full=Flavin adenine dinucleotide synthase [Thermoplasma acidophilum DSM 1728]MCY0851871.1 FAD synthase [Thermoplasma acidophilum]CAC12265.1 Aut related protein [Thermoplasma acidophilum]
MVRVMATGVFDIIHLGHIHYLRESKKLGDELVVVVARDSTARKNGKVPIFDENSRLKLVSELKPVDRAILGHEDDMMKTVVEVMPDIITLGYDQKFDEADLKRKLDQIGVNSRIVRISKYDGNLNSSSMVRKKIMELIGERF